MPVNVKYEQFRFSPAKYYAPTDTTRDGCVGANELLKTANEIVRQVARAGWDVPGIDITISYSGGGKNVIKYCSNVSFDLPAENGKTTRVELGFYNPSASRAGRRTPLGSASRVKVGDVECNMYNDGSGDWFKKSKVEEALAKIRPKLEELRNLPSKPGFDDEHPEGDLNLRQICTSEPIPAPDDFPVLYTWVERNDAYNALGIAGEGLEGDYALEADFRVVGNGYRFINTDYGIKWDEIPAGGWDGYSYATSDVNVKPTGLIFHTCNGILPVEVKLKHLDDIYVADMAPYENAREVDWQRVQEEGRDEYTSQEIADQRRATMSTFIPASDYKGGYEKPVFMIGRQLHADEARAMAGPVSVVMEDGFAVAKMVDVMNDRDVILYEGGEELYHKHYALRTAQELSSIFNRTPEVDPQITEAITEHQRKLREEYKNDKAMSLLIG
jgi:hypothetical protein